MAYNHQDWTEVVLNKKTSQYMKETKKKTLPVVTSSVSNKPAWKIEQDVDGEVGKPLKYISVEDAHCIVNGRISKKLSQQALATQLNMKLREIQDIESRKAIENKAIIGKIKGFLSL
jgi:ribosome-binding protein aMBF1 (putative translation factor)